MPSMNFMDSSLMYRDYIDAIVYLVSVVSAVAMVGWRISRRKAFAARCMACFAVMAAFICGVTYPIQLATYSGEFADMLIWFHTAKFFAIFIFSGIAVKICCDCDWWAALFCATAGYCMQHINARINAIIQDIPLASADWAIKLCVTVAVNILIYVIFYFAFIRRSPKNVIVRVNERWQVELAVCVVGISICYNSFGVSFGYQVITYCANNGIDSTLGYDILIFNYVMSLIIAILILALEFGNYRNKELSLERDLLKQLLAEKRAQYESEKHNIELINIKCHDIKHQLDSLKGEVYEEQLKELGRAINIYDNSVKTGSDALDVVLRQKMLFCGRNDIRLTCMIDGEKLAFMPEHEQYSLFCNAVDNAIDGVKDIPAEKRVIGLTESLENGKYIIRIENYFEGRRDFKGGVPATTKSGEGHGYGVKSMKMIVASHGGMFSAGVNGDTFVTQFIFPASVIGRTEEDAQNRRAAACKGA